MSADASVHEGHNDRHERREAAPSNGIGIENQPAAGTSGTPEPRRGDILVRSAGVPVIVDPKTALYLKGTVLDYSDKMVAGGFKFSNPNAKASCSCGESFSA